MAQTTAPSAPRGVPKCLPPAPGWDAAPFQMQPRAQLPGATAAPGVTASPSHVGQVKIRSLILDSYIWIPAGGRKASGTDRVNTTEFVITSSEPAPPSEGSLGGADHRSHGKSAQMEGSLFNCDFRQRRAAFPQSLVGEYLQPPLGAYAYAWRTYQENLKCHDLSSMGGR